jgi:hypothetical protein
MDFFRNEGKPRIVIAATIHKLSEIFELKHTINVVFIEYRKISTTQPLTCIFY